MPIPLVFVCNSKIFVTSQWLWLTYWMCSLSTETPHHKGAIRFLNWDRSIPILQIKRHITHRTWRVRHSYFNRALKDNGLKEFMCSLQVVKKRTWCLYNAFPGFTALAVCQKQMVLCVYVQIASSSARVLILCTYMHAMVCLNSNKTLR